MDKTIKLLTKINNLFLLKIKNYKIIKKTKNNLNKNKNKKNRKLEIGPGIERILNFETLNITDSPTTDYVLNASKKLPFLENTFSIIYASHILEHIPWYQTEETLKEWIRIIKKGGILEIWVPDGFKICKAFIKGETENTNKYTKNDGWYRFNDEKDNCKWASGRIFTYGDGTGNIDNPNWHHALFSKRYLIKLFKKYGMNSIKVMKNKEVRGYDHGWINLGIRGIKK